MGTATLIRDHLARFSGHAALYRLEPPLDGNELVAVSATSRFGCETYIFPANDRGEVTDWGELDGSYRGGLDHAEALRRAGYEIATPPTLADEPQIVGG